MPQPKDKDCLNGYKNKTPYMLPTRDPLQNTGHIQTESERLEKEILGGSKITAYGDCSHEILKDACFLEEKLWST